MLFSQICLFLINPTLVMTTPKNLLLLFIFFCTCASISAQDSMIDNSRIISASQPMVHMLDYFTIHGVPKNQNPDSLLIVLNHGYCIGFSPKYNQPLWTAYQVSKAKQDVDYERFPFFVDDRRLPLENQIDGNVYHEQYLPSESRSESRAMAAT